MNKISRRLSPSSRPSDILLSPLTVTKTLQPNETAGQDVQKDMNESPSRSNRP